LNRGGFNRIHKGFRDNSSNFSNDGDKENQGFRANQVKNKYESPNIGHQPS